MKVFIGKHIHIFCLVQQVYLICVVMKDKLFTFEPLNFYCTIQSVTVANTHNLIRKIIIFTIMISAISVDNVKTWDSLNFVITRAPKTPEAQGCKPWVTHLRISIIPSTLGVPTANITYCIIILQIRRWVSQVNVRPCVVCIYTYHWNLKLVPNLTRHHTRIGRWRSDKSLSL